MNLASFAAGLVISAALTGCASMGCEPREIVVDAREQRTRLDSEFRGLRTTEIGRVKEERRDVLVPEWWVRARNGKWYQVPEAVWRTAEPGRTVAVCG
jgi:hypothetical protein